MTNPARSCRQCGAAVRGNFPWCPVCGSALFPATNEEQIHCENHTDSPAEGFCVVCSKPLCSECVRIQSGAVVCGDSSHTDLLSGWARVFDSMMEFEVDMMERNLELAGMPCRVFFRRAHLAGLIVKEFTGGRVFVPRERIEQATGIVTALLEDTITSS